MFNRIMVALLVVSLLLSGIALATSADSSKPAISDVDDGVWREATFDQIQRVNDMLYMRFRLLCEERGIPLDPDDSATIGASSEYLRFEDRPCMSDTQWHAVYNLVEESLMGYTISVEEDSPAFMYRDALMEALLLSLFEPEENIPARELIDQARAAMQDIGEGRIVGTSEIEGGKIIVTQHGTAHALMLLLPESVRVLPEDVPSTE